MLTFTLGKTCGATASNRRPGTPSSLMDSCFLCSPRPQPEWEGSGNPPHQPATANNLRYRSCCFPRGVCSSPLSCSGAYWSLDKQHGRDGAQPGRGGAGLGGAEGPGCPCSEPRSHILPKSSHAARPSAQEDVGIFRGPPPTPCWPGCVEAPAPPLHLARFSRGFPLPLAAGDPVTVMLREGFLGERLCSAKDEGVIQRRLGSEREVSQAGTF